MYSMEARIKMSCFTLNAADHTRSTGLNRNFVLCALDRAEGMVTVLEPVMNVSVVATRLSMSSLNDGCTVNK
jgi:hypothetical protein